jgi:hypothetical protein
MHATLKYPLWVRKHRANSKGVTSAGDARHIALMQEVQLVFPFPCCSEI